MQNSEERTVMYDYEAEDETNVTIATGDVLIVTDDSNSDWWRGHHRDNPSRDGYYPLLSSN